MNNVVGIYINYNCISWCVINLRKRKVMEIGAKEITYKRKQKYNKGKRFREELLCQLLDEFNIGYCKEKVLESLNDKKNIFSLRKKALNQRINNDELITLLYYFILNRGDINEIQGDFVTDDNCRSYGEWVYDNDMIEKKNVNREWLVAELSLIFNSQRRYKNEICKFDNLINEYISIFDYSDEMNTDMELKQEEAEMEDDDVSISKLYKIIKDKNKDKVINNILYNYMDIAKVLKEKYQPISSLTIYIEVKLRECKKEEEIINIDLLVESFKEKNNRKPTYDEIEKMKLYKEQNGICIYSGEEINYENIFKKGFYEVDHIIPRSRGGSNSYSNKLLVKWNENRDKKNMTPYEYFQTEKSTDEWIKYKERAISLKNQEKIDYLINENILKYKSEKRAINANQRGTIYKFIKLMSEYNCFSFLKGKIFMVKDGDNVFNSMFQENKKINIDDYKNKEYYLYSFLLASIDAEVYKYLINPDKKGKVELFYKNQIEQFNELVKFKENPKPIEFIQKKLTELTREDLDLIWDKYLNRNLVEYIKLRMEQFNYEAEDAFKDEVFMPSKNWNGTIVKKIKIKIDNKIGEE